MPAARTAPAAARNREPILAVLRDLLPPRALVLEVASGTGEHAVWFSTALPGLTWQPTDRDAEALASIAAWRDQAGPPNLLPPQLIQGGSDIILRDYCCSRVHRRARRHQSRAGRPGQSCRGRRDRRGRRRPKEGPRQRFGSLKTLPHSGQRIGPIMLATFPWPAS